MLRNYSGEISQVQGSGLNDVVAVAAGAEHGLALRSTGEVVAWGQNTIGQTNVPVGLKGVTGIAAGFYDSMALRSNGTVVVWGSNRDGEKNVPPGLTNVAGIAAGGYFDYAFLRDGGVVAWGDNRYGQITYPSELKNVASFAADSVGSVAALRDGTVLAFWYGPVNVPAGLRNVAQVSCDSLSAAALVGDGTVVAWDSERSSTNSLPFLTNIVAVAGNLALKSDRTVVTLSGVPVAGLSNVVAISSRSWHDVILVNDGQPYRPLVLQHPQNATVFEADNVTFKSSVVGVAPLYYQWEFNGTNIAGATKSALTVSNVGLKSEGYYAVKVSNKYGAVRSAPADLKLLPQVVGFASPEYAVSESAGVAMVTVGRASGIGTLSVQFETVDGTARAGIDYIATNGTLVFASGQTNRSLPIRLINNSTVDEGRNFRLMLSAPSAGQLGQAEAEVTILDEDCSLGFTQLNYSAQQDQSVVRIDVVRQGNTNGTVSVDFAFGGGTAEPGKDYEAAAGTLTFGPGVTNQTVNLLLVEHSEVFRNKTIEVHLGNLSGGAMLAGSGVALITVVDERYITGIASAAYEADEAAGAVLTVMRNCAEGPLSVRFATRDGTARSGIDYVATNGILTFATGQTNLSFAVSLLNNSTLDGWRTFSVTLSEHSDGRLEQSSATVTIIDDAADLTGIDESMDEKELRQRVAVGGTIPVTAERLFQLSAPLVISKDTIIDGTAHRLTLSGGGSNRVITVEAGVMLVLSNVTVMAGRAEIAGGLFNDHGSATLVQCVFTNNRSIGTNGGTDPVWPYAGLSGGAAAGGAILSFGDLRLVRSEFSANHAFGGRGGPPASRYWGGIGGAARGGAVYSSGRLEVDACSFVSNSVSGGNGGDAGRESDEAGGPGGQAEGGALYAEVAVALTNSILQFNTAQAGGSGGGYSGTGGDAHGGAVVLSSGYALISNSELKGNSVRGGRAGGVNRGRAGTGLGGGLYISGELQLIRDVCAGNIASEGAAAGGAIYQKEGSLFASGCRFLTNSSRCGSPVDYYHGDNGFQGKGGAALCSGNSRWQECSFWSNSAFGGGGAAGGGGGHAFGGALFCGGTETSVERCSFIANSAWGGGGSSVGNNYFQGAGAGGDGFGGGIEFAAGTGRITNCTLFANLAQGGEGASAYSMPNYYVISGGAGGASGGAAIYSSTTGVVLVAHCTVISNRAEGGHGGTGVNGGADGLNGRVLGDALSVSSNALTSVTSSIFFGNQGGDLGASVSSSFNLLGLDPRVDTLTVDEQGLGYLPLLPDSPAIDALSGSAGAETDQRGVPRAYGNGLDIGAYEWNGTNFYRAFVLSSLANVDGQWRLHGGGPPTNHIRLLSSTNLLDWVNSAEINLDARGLFEVKTPVNDRAARTFFRIAVP